MKKFYLLWLFWAFVIIAFSQNAGTISQKNQPMDKNQYVSEWRKVADFEKKSLPKSASEVVDGILRQAIADKNSPQVIKALIHQGKYDLVQDDQNDTLIFHNLKEMVAKSNDAVERSVLHSMLGELYLQYYQEDQWNIDQRTPLGDYVPDDMKEWTRNIFYDKVIAHINASLDEEKALLKANVESYAAVVELGKDSRRFYPSMYDFLVRRAIELSGRIMPDEDLSRTLSKRNIEIDALFAPADEFVDLTFAPKPSEHGLWTLEYFRRHLFSLDERGMIQSVLFTQLDKLDYLRRLESAYMTYALPSFERMRKEWEGVPISVEIIDRMVQFRLQEINRYNPEDTLSRKEKTGEIYNMLKTGIASFPNYERISVLQNRLSQLTQSGIKVTGANTFSLNSKKELTLNYRNIRSLKAHLYRIDSPIERLEAEQGRSQRNRTRRTLVDEISILLPDQPDYWMGETSFSVNPDGYGTYVLIFESSPRLESSDIDAEYYFSVTDMAVFTRASGENRYDFFVVDRTTGEPISGAMVDIYKLPGNWRNSKLILDRSVTTDKDGLAVYDKTIPNFDVFYHAVKGEDTGAALSRLPYGRYSYSEIGNDQAKGLDIFTDRSIYRPGQTLYFKSVLSKKDLGDMSVIPGKKIELVLRDANRRELSKNTLTTNEFGSVAGEFVLPQGALPGYYIIEAKEDGVEQRNMAYGSLSFRVEEYKRPTFEVSFDKVKGSYRFGEAVNIKGKAVSFSGISLQEATVEYTITRRPIWWHFWGGTTDHFLSGNVTTTNDGGFEISFTPEKPDGQQGEKMIYSFDVEATVTDINGETQQASYSITVGDIALMLALEMSEKWEKNSDEKIVISAKNLDGEDVAVAGSYKLYSLHENDSVRELVAEGQFEPGDQPELKNLLGKKTSGKYRFVLQAEDDWGNEVKAEKDIILFSHDDKRPPIKTNEWLVVKSAIFSPNKKGEVILGATDKINVLYELWQGNNLIERKWDILDNENRLFSVPFKEQYREGVTLMLTYVKDQKFYTHKVDIIQEKPKNKLTISLDVFRDKIRPGAEEEWRISVKSHDGTPSSAEVLASMYDFSLDNIFSTQDWNFISLPASRYFSSMELQEGSSFYLGRVVINQLLQNKEVKPFAFDRFNWYGYSLYYSGRMMLRSSKSSVYAGVNVVEESVMTENRIEIASTDDMAQLGLMENVVDVAAQDAPPSPSPQDLSTDDQYPQIRRNFNETAFFYPHLRTNEKGETLIAFTVPESNTKWRFRVLAHDKNLNSGTSEAFTVSQKELMVTPNMPRFLRQGDKASIFTKISNMLDGPVNGIVTLELFNPLTEEAIRSIEVQGGEQLFSLEKGASSDARWAFDVPTDIDLIGVRVVARSERFSDGEQHALVVLPNRMMVTESMRMDVSGGETKEFTLDGLLDKKLTTAEEYRLTLEFASNPAWYAVQALPVLSEPESDNAVSWFATYYANSLGSHIGKTFPKVKAMMDAWRQQGGNKESFVSNLKKNQELKSVLLEETPWVLEAKNETEQKERLSLLFDLNRTRNLTSSAIAKLHELQTNQGGWSWFKGFQPSVSITHYILYGFSQLIELNALSPAADVLAMQQKAIGYIDAEAIRRFEELKKHNKDWKNIKTVSLVDLEYLFVRQSYENLVPYEEVKELINFYLSVAEKNWMQYGLYERSLIAIMLLNEGENSIVEDILKSFREHATVSAEMGMYWANNRSHVFMSQSAVSVHTFIMNAFRKAGASSQEMDAMKRWLLKQKQTQLWKTTHATVDAVYALLSSGNDWFTADSETIITMGGKDVMPKKSELGTGYFKVSWSRDAIIPEMGEVIVRHEGDAPAWGALYRQYFEEIDKVEKSDGSLDIEKQLFVEQSSSTGKQLVQITDGSPLKVGDKVIVRLTVRADRDLEYVHLKDMRAAAFEPAEQLSGMGWQNGIPYYRTSKDASTGFYFNVLPRGTYVFEYAVYVTRPGDYSNGITTIQCMYAPEFTSHTAGIRIIVKE